MGARWDNILFVMLSGATRPDISVLRPFPPLNLSILKRLPIGVALIKSRNVFISYLFQGNTL
jgi:hypothetical protein